MAPQPEKRKVGGPTPPLTTIQLATDEALTSANTDCTFPCLSQSSDHDYPYVTAVGRSLSHADRTPCFRAPRKAVWPISNFASSGAIDSPPNFARR